MPFWEVVTPHPDLLGRGRCCNFVIYFNDLFHRLLLLQRFCFLRMAGLWDVTSPDEEGHAGVGAAAILRSQSAFQSY